MPSPLKTWLQLLRAPNLFTVPGDPLAGFLLATTTSGSAVVLLPIGASLCFYSAGLLFNDLADLEEDRRERPARPLPSRGAEPRKVWITSIFLTLAGLGLSATGGLSSILVAICLVSAILVYNFGLKKIPVAGPLLMGVCRGLSLLLGATFSSGISHLILGAALAETLYIASVTHLARHETKPRQLQPAALLPCASLIATAVIFACLTQITGRIAFLSFFTLAVASTGRTTLRILQRHPLPPLIGNLIAAFIFVQAAFCAGSHTGWTGSGCALLLLLFWFGSRFTSRHFYAS